MKLSILNFSYLLSTFIVLAIACNEQKGKEADMAIVPHQKGDGAKDRQAVTDALDAFNRALVETDSLALEKLTSEALSYGHSSGLIQDKAEFLEDVLHGPFEYISIASPELSVSVQGGTAIVRHIFSADGINNGEEVYVEIGTLQVWQRQEGGTWELLARQAFKL